MLLFTKYVAAERLATLNAAPEGRCCAKFGRCNGIGASSVFLHFYWYNRRYVMKTHKWVNPTERVQCYSRGSIRMHDRKGQRIVVWRGFRHNRINSVTGILDRMTVHRATGGRVISSQPMRFVDDSIR